MSNVSFMGRQRGRALVAEDDVEMRRVLVDTLKGEGYDVYDVGDGAALLIELARNHRFHYDTVDVVVADVRMPLCSGLQALETIRSVRPRLPFVLLTAFGDEEMHARATTLGAELLDKPVSMKSVSAAVARAIRRR
jgi:DNA-binding response OmpR family regulator